MNNKTAQKIIILSSIILSFIFVATTTYAYSCIGYRCDSYNYNPNNNQGYPQYDYYQQVVPIPYVPNNTTTKTNPTVINNYYYQNENIPGNTTTLNKEDNSTDNISSMNSGQLIEEDYYRNNLGASAYNGYSQSEGSEITALSLRGSGGFMPSSIWQWILVVILILIIIIIARMFVRKPHPADHDNHGSHAH